MALGIMPRTSNPGAAFLTASSIAWGLLPVSIGPREPERSF
jgi:hypothetical protein